MSEAKTLEQIARDAYAAVQGCVYLDRANNTVGHRAYMDERAEAIILRACEAARAPVLRGQNIVAEYYKKENVALRAQLAEVRAALGPCVEYMAGVVGSGYDEDGLDELVQRARAALAPAAPDEDSRG